MANSPAVCALGRRRFWGERHDGTEAQDCRTAAAFGLGLGFCSERTDDIVLVLEHVVASLRHSEDGRLDEHGADLDSPAVWGRPPFWEHCDAGQGQAEVPSLFGPVAGWKLAGLDEAGQVAFGSVRGAIRAEQVFNAVEGLVAFVVR